MSHDKTFHGLDTTRSDQCYPFTTARTDNIDRYELDYDHEMLLS